MKGSSEHFFDVGERRFRVSHATLEKSPYLKRMLVKGGEFGILPFLDQDGDTFAHILRYLRSGVYPILYSKASGYDYQMYALIYEQANFLELEHLATWIKDQQYQGVIKTSYRHAINDKSFNAEETDAKTTQVEFESMLGAESSYVCPRGILLHHGNPDNCGAKCKKSQPDIGQQYLAKVVERTAITKISTELDLAKCRARDNNGVNFQTLTTRNYYPGGDLWAYRDQVQPDSDLL